MPTLGGVVDFTTMLSIAVQLKKAAVPMLVMPAGKVMVGNAVHLMKENPGISVSASESVTDIKLVQEPKAPFPMEVTLLGIMSSVKPEV